LRLGIFYTAMKALVNAPLASAEAVLEKARLVRESEQEWFDFANSSDFTVEGVKRRIPH